MCAVQRRGLALREVVVVLGALAVLVLGARPVLVPPRAANQRAACLANLQALGAATQAYAAEDAQNLIVPIHRNMVRTCPYWAWRTVNWFAYGGANATQPFMFGYAGWWLSDVGPPPPDAIWNPAYGASHRPLNPYVSGALGGENTLAPFHCPADVGYPDDPYLDATPSYNALRPCWKTLGNSYRANLEMYGQMSQAGAGPSSGHFGFGPFGHPLWMLLNPNRVVLLADPLFYEQLPGHVAHDAENWGWHGDWRTENVLYCDGSARPTSTEGAVTGLGHRPSRTSGPPICAGDEEERPITGGTFQIDCYPAPGAVVWGNWDPYIEAHPDCWPWGDAYDMSP